VPAAAVIPAPIAYVKVVAVKKLVVGLVSVGCGDLRPKGRCDRPVLVPSNLQLGRRWP
jgi:hypothetical protein